jgi:heme exporter protein A
MRGVSKSFGGTHALRGVDLDVPAGDFVVITGVNGAGKTTLLRIAAGLARPSRGALSIAGVEHGTADPGLRRLVGFVSHAGLMYGRLTGEENLLLHARLFGLADPAARVRELAARLGAEQVLGRPVQGLSRGTVQRLALVRALLHDPAILLLDEPYAGLDERTAPRLTALLRDLNAAGQTVVLSTHERSCLGTAPRREVVLDRGRIRADGPFRSFAAAAEGGR